MTTEIREPERLDQEECRRLLATEDVGRLAVVQGTTPAIFPVNYVVDGDAVVFRTAPGTKLWHGVDSLAAFEIDGLCREHRSGWSVVATGRLEQVGPGEGAAAAPDRLRRLPLAPWDTGPKEHWMRLVPGIVTGRRVGGPCPAGCPGP